MIFLSQQPELIQTISGNAVQSMFILENTFQHDLCASGEDNKFREILTQVRSLNSH